MKRNINLQSLSKDHHHGLLLGWKIRQGLKRGAALSVISEYVSYFAMMALFPHFEEEESVILPFMTNDNELKQRTIAEHKLIKELILLIGADPKESCLIELADLIDQHIRFEERLLFPYLESVLSGDDLLLIGEQLKENHHSFVDTYHDEFWKSSNEQEMSV